MTPGKFSMQPLFATPFGVGAVGAADALNPELARLFRERATEPYRDQGLPHDALCFRGCEDLFEWDQACVTRLREDLLDSLCTLVMSANLYTEAECSDLIVQARARFVIVRPDGCLPASSATTSSWCALYCVVASAPPETRRDSGVLRIYGLRQGCTFIDTANWHLRPPFGSEHRVYRLAPRRDRSFSLLDAA